MKPISDGYRLRLGLLSDAEETRQQDAIGALSDLPIYIDDTPIQGIVEMRGKARRLQTERGLDMLVVDYLQLISGGGGRSDNRVQEMGEILPVAQGTRARPRHSRTGLLAAKSRRRAAAYPPGLCCRTSVRAGASSRMPTLSRLSIAKTSTRPEKSGRRRTRASSTRRTSRS